MGLGLKNLCISNEKIYEVPLNHKKGQMMEPKLANQTVLNMEITYETQNRKPNEITHINFDQITFDNEGIFDINAAILSDEFRVQFEYANRYLSKAIGSITGVELSPLPIPKAPVTPNNQEIDLIKAYLNQKYPLLLKNSPHAIEYTIEADKVRHKDNIKEMKNSYLKG